jgi:hypothetical protein
MRGAWGPWKGRFRSGATPAAGGFFLVVTFVPAASLDPAGGINRWLEKLSRGTHRLQNGVTNDESKPCGIGGDV